MSDTVIQIENISKLYQLGEISTGTLSRDMHRWWARFRGQEDPFKKVGQVNDRTKKSESDIVWALKDISFDVKKGEVLGIIGNNGAGKSTLLKILSRVTKPTSGRIRVKGRIASLLEVGTGFHQELTGRENIFLNGAIMGMKKAEIRAKLDEIVAFSGVERYIDTPVKRYSSGMHVRLGFAVAAHLEPEILVIDEVLAVGDAEFQKKCLGKMKDVSEKEGRTVLFVSHNMEAVQKLCTKGLYLKHGSLIAANDIGSITNQYLSEETTPTAQFFFPHETRQYAAPGVVSEIHVEDLQGNPLQSISTGELWQIRVKFSINQEVNHFIAGLGIINQLGVKLNTTWTTPCEISRGEYEVCFINNYLLLGPGKYSIDIGLSSYQKTFEYISGQAYITISEALGELPEQIVNTKSGFILNQFETVITDIGGVILRQAI